MTGLSALNERLSLQSLIDWVIGEEHIVQFREDFKWIVYEESSKFQHWNENNRSLQAQAYQGLEDARATQWNKLAIVLGAIGVILGFFVSVGTIVSVASLFLSALGGLHKVTVDILAYDQPYREHRNRRLKFMSAWNRGPMNSWKAFLIIPIGLFIRYFPRRYKSALWFLEGIVGE